MDCFWLIYILSCESFGNKLQKGCIDEEKIVVIQQVLFVGQKIDGVYVCGFELMIYVVKNKMQEFGVDEKNIYFELFVIFVLKKFEIVQVELDMVFNVQIIMDGDEFDVYMVGDGISIFDVVYQVGVDVFFVCKGGVCCICKVKIIEGSVCMDVNYVFEKDEVEVGFIFICQVYFILDKFVVLFDY